MTKYYVIKDGGTVATTSDQEYTLEQIIEAVNANQIESAWWCYYEDGGKLRKTKIEKLLKKASQEALQQPIQEVQKDSKEEVQQAPEEPEVQQVPQEVPQKEALQDIPKEALQDTQEEVQQDPEVQQTPKVHKETYKYKIDKLIEYIKDKFNKFISWLKVWTMRAAAVVAVSLGIYIWVLHSNVEKEVKLRDDANTALVKLNLDYEDRIKSLKSDIEELKKPKAVYSGKTPMSNAIVSKRQTEFVEATKEYTEACEECWYLTESWQLSRRAKALAKWGRAYERLFIYADAKASKGLKKNEYASLYALYVASAIYTGHIDNPDIGLEDGIKMCEHNWESVKDFIMNLELKPHHQEAIEAVTTL